MNTIIQPAKLSRFYAGKCGFIITIVLLFLVTAFLASCSQGLKGNSASAQPWTIGFWLWAGGSVDSAAGGNRHFDVLYVQVGRVDNYAVNSVSWPWQANLPPAASYWALWRYEGSARPAETQIAVIAGAFLKRKAEAAARGQAVVGLQIDYDCPTDELAEYAKFLDELSQALPQETKISITALLDWFRSGTHIRDLLSHTNEFVPQFYDTYPNAMMRAIAAPIDAKRWGPVFNAFGIPYRLGISTFGRINYIQKGQAQGFRDLTPLDILEQPGLNVINTGQTPAGEQRSLLQAERRTDINNWTVSAGDQIEMILPTRSSVLAAYNATKQMGGSCAGAVFFRWPTTRETLVINPDQVLSWITHTEISPKQPVLEVEQGNCAAVSCSDLQIYIADRLPEHAAAFLIQSSLPLEYFIPDPRIKSKIKVTGVSSLRLALPAFHGAGMLYLGRAVSLDAARFTVTEEK